jgi:predicted MFS family arabinose efflux permease
MLLFGFGIGNATSLPPLIAQSEFTKLDAARVVPLIVAVSQASYAFAPAIFGLVRDAAAPTSLPLFAGAAAVMALAMLSLLVGRQKRSAELHAPDTNN